MVMYITCTAHVVVVAKEPRFYKKIFFKKKFVRKKYNTGLHKQSNRGRSLASHADGALALN